MQSACKRAAAFLVAVCVLFTSHSPAAMAQAQPRRVVLPGRTAAEMQAQLARAPVQLDMPLAYDTQPDLQAFTTAGQLREAVLQNALNTWNLARYTVFLSPVAQNQEYTPYAQHAAALHAAQQGIGAKVWHMPPASWKAAAMPDDFWAAAFTGCTGSCLWAGSASAAGLAGAVAAMLAGGSEYGYYESRFLLLSGAVEQAGFGAAQNTQEGWAYYALYAPGPSSPGAAFVPWPAQNTPQGLAAGLFSFWSQEVMDDPTVSVTSRLTGQTTEYSKEAGDLEHPLSGGYIIGDGLIFGDRTRQAGLQFDPADVLEVTVRYTAPDNTPVEVCYLVNTLEGAPVADRWDGTSQTTGNNTSAPQEDAARPNGTVGASGSGSAGSSGGAVLALAAAGVAAAAAVVLYLRARVAQVYGTVAGPQGAPLAGAQVAFVRDGAAVACVSTAADGSFALQLPVGVYEIYVYTAGQEAAIPCGQAAVARHMAALRLAAG